MSASVSIQELQSRPHKRYNPLTDEWVVVSPHRTKRPWQGSADENQAETTPSYDPNCYLCPGNERAGGAHNPNYSDTFSFVNDFAALKPEGEPGRMDESSLFRAETERGICKVICFTPRHDLTMARMSPDEIIKVVQLWKREYGDIAATDFINYIQIFENRGALMGCSQPHPHGQIWSNETLPDLPAKENRAQIDYYRVNQRPLLLDYAETEEKKGERIIAENQDFMVLIPFWAVWPYETMILPKRHIQHVTELSEREESSLAQILKIITVKYDNLFRTSFPYSMGLHNAPCDGKDHPAWQFHIHFLPPLLRSATVKKFMVGYELLATPQRDLTAETAAATIRELPETHYQEREEKK